MTAPNAEQRRTLRFANIDELVADIQHLKKGYTRVGNWSLAQMCWHLNSIENYLMTPGDYPPDSPEQLARRPMLVKVLESGRIATGIEAPERVVPPVDCNDRVIDEFIETLKRFNAFAGPYAPHRLFGRVTSDEMRQLNLIHCAHHLGHLFPTAGA